mgnify:FL=1
MARGSTEKIAEKLAMPIVEQLNFELVDVEYKKEGANWVLRYYIDKPGGINLDDCQMFSEKISEVLDKEDPISQGYYLEVSSPGLDRPLKKPSDFERFRGRNVELRLYKAKNNRKKYIGELVGLQGNKIIIKVDDKILEFDSEEVSIVRLVIEI